MGVAEFSSSQKCKFEKVFIIMNLLVLLLHLGIKSIDFWYLIISGNMYITYIYM